MKKTQDERVYKRASVGTGTVDDSGTRLGHDLSKGKEKGKRRVKFTEVSAFYNYLNVSLAS